MTFQRNCLCLLLDEEFICSESQHFAVTSAHKSFQKGQYGSLTFLVPLKDPLLGL